MQKHKMATPFCAFTAAVDCVRTKAKPKKRMAARSAAILFLGFAFVLIHSYKTLDGFDFQFTKVSPRFCELVL
jgi:hypothetical protein